MNIASVNREFKFIFNPVPAFTRPRCAYLDTYKCFNPWRTCTIHGSIHGYQTELNQTSDENLTLSLHRQPKYVATSAEIIHTYFLGLVLKSLHVIGVLVWFRMKLYPWE